MKFIADLHVHSKYSRATAKNLDLENLYLWAQYKGIQIVGTGDFVHPKWFKELEEKLEEAKRRIAWFEKHQFGRKTEKEMVSGDEPIDEDAAVAKSAALSVKRSRGQQPGQPGHGTIFLGPLPGEENRYAEYFR